MEFDENWKNLIEQGHINTCTESSEVTILHFIVSGNIVMTMLSMHNVYSNYTTQIFPVIVTDC